MTLAAPARFNGRLERDCYGRPGSDQPPQTGLDVRFSRPARGLEPFVRFYVQRKAHIPDPAVIHPVPARTAPMIEFDFGDSVDVFHVRTQVRRKSAPLVVVGPQTHRRLDLHLRGTLEHFVIMFQPDGLQRLYSLPMHELADADYEADSVLGASIWRAWQRLGNLESFEERVRLIDQMLLRRALQLPESDGISAAAWKTIVCGGLVNVHGLARLAGVSTRQFARRFVRQIGVSPKLFARMARFEAALQSKARFAAKSWTQIAYEFGYYDQMHMIHDFKDFTGASPKEMLSRLEALFTNEIRQIRSSAAAPNVANESRLIM